LHSEHARSPPQRINATLCTLVTFHISRSRHALVQPGSTFDSTLIASQSGTVLSLTSHQPSLHPLFTRFNSSRGTQDLFARKADLTAAQCHFVSAEGRREFVSEQFDSTPEILTFFREPISRTVSQWNHDKQCVMGPPLALTVEYYCTIPCLHTVT